jgi:uncharacterized membrane protein (UPF0127 family)|tara:strand:+ start:190 stop:672 length:483 start_codon:yes stop_codon:yes gene_type:complete
MDSIKNKKILVPLLLLMLLFSILIINIFSQKLDNDNKDIQLKEVKFLSSSSNQYITLLVEVPNKENYGIGLSNKDKLDNQGMLFKFENQNKYRGFSMKNTKINLSIAFINSKKIIVDIQEMEAGYQTIYTSKFLFLYAIEAPEKWFQKNNIKPGDSVTLP